MANHKSALKRSKQSQVRRLRNRARNSRMKTAVKAVDTAIEENSVEAAQEALRAAIPIIDRVAVKGNLHKKNASRKVSRLTKRVNAFVAAAQQS
ncbi:MAG TPA: 30S ribosomal protein S20 [Desulfobacterales bacterium]|nr:30S ribosomal protein S20 [Desulfobacterales bacterium]